MAKAWNHYIRNAVICTVTAKFIEPLLSLQFFLFMGQILDAEKNLFPLKAFYKIEHKAGTNLVEWLFKYLLVIGFYCYPEGCASCSI